MRDIVQGAALAHHVGAEVKYTREFVPLINDAALAEEALAAARTALGVERAGLGASADHRVRGFCTLVDAQTWLLRLSRQWEFEAAA